MSESTAGEGWTCPHCGSWVGATMSHWCPVRLNYGSAGTAGYISALQPDYGPALERIADALERIVSAIDEMPRRRR